MEILKADSAGFRALWTELYSRGRFQHPLFQPGNIAYYRALTGGDDVTDYSFLLAHEGVPLCGVLMSANGHDQGPEIELTGFGLPVLFVTNRDVPLNELKSGFRYFTEELSRLLVEQEISSIIYRDFLIDNAVSLFGRYLLDNGAGIKSYFTQVIDLTQSETAMKQQVRKSCKNWINWGEKNIELRIVESSSISRDDIEQFRTLHIQAAGRETRTESTWDFQFGMVSDQEAFLIMGSIDNKLVTAALFPYSNDYCFYGVSASDRENFDKPISHSTVWNAILHARKLGCARFELGPQYYTIQDPDISAKELGISSFKRGFGGNTLVRLDLTWNRMPES